MLLRFAYVLLVAWERLHHFLGSRKILLLIVIKLCKATSKFSPDFALTLWNPVELFHSEQVYKDESLTSWGRSDLVATKKLGIGSSDYKIWSFNSTTLSKVYGSVTSHTARALTASRQYTLVIVVNIRSNPTISRYWILYGLPSTSKNLMGVWYFFYWRIIAIIDEISLFLGLTKVL